MAQEAKVCAEYSFIKEKQPKHQLMLSYTTEDVKNIISFGRTLHV